jgi:pyruvate/2-oxoacid:ferredoxin oxidoreductase beta subunit
MPNHFYFVVLKAEKTVGTYSFVILLSDCIKHNTKKVFVKHSFDDETVILKAIMWERKFKALIDKDLNDDYNWD